MPCTLKLIGKQFDVDSFINETKLKPYKVFRIGDKINNNKVCENNGCCFDVSNADFLDFNLQQNDAILFLKENFEQLKLINNYSLLNEDKPSLDFGICTRMFDENVAIQSDFINPELSFLAGSLNIWIEISQYVCRNN